MEPISSIIFSELDIIDEDFKKKIYKIQSRYLSYLDNNNWSSGVTKWYKIVFEETLPKFFSNVKMENVNMFAMKILMFVT